MKFNFIDIDKSVLPTAKGKRQGKYRFYDINGTNYPSVTSILGVRKKVELQQWRDKIGENVANWEMGRFLLVEELQLIILLKITSKVNH